MKLTNGLLLFATAISFDAFADKVYKTVDETGNVTFTDKKTSDAEKIEVKPNVVDLDIPKPTEKTKDKPQQSQTRSQPDRGESETVDGGGYSDDPINRKRPADTKTDETIDKLKDKIKDNRQPVTIQPVKRPAVRQGGGRR